LGQIPDERLPCKAPIVLELAHKVPPIVPHPFEEWLRGIPRVEEDTLRLTVQAIPCIAQQLYGASKLRGTAFVPEPKGERETDLPIRPDQEHDRDPEDDLALLTRPDPRRFAQQPCIGLFDHSVIEYEIPTSDGAQQA
jgi:hypothetical protein